MSEKVFKYRQGFKPALLWTESEEEFYQQYSSWEKYINPTNPLLEMQLNDIVASRWEELRAQKCKPVSLSVGSAKALPLLFSRLGICPGPQAEGLVKGWMAGGDGRDVVKRHLAEFNLDEMAIIAVALESNKAYELADKLQSSSENRRRKAVDMLLELQEASSGSTSEAQQQDALPVVSETPSIADGDSESA